MQKYKRMFDRVHHCTYIRTMMKEHGLTFYDIVFISREIDMGDICMDDAHKIVHAWKRCNVMR